MGENARAVEVKHLRSPEAALGEAPVGGMPAVSYVLEGRIWTASTTSPSRRYGQMDP
jgi:hypothetical protein